MKKFLTLFVLLLLVLSGCTHTVDSKLYLENFNGKGHQVLRVVILEEDVGDLVVVRDAIMPVIEAADPLDDSTLTNSIIGGTSLVFTYTFSFENFNEYQVKVGKLTGRNDIFISALEGEDPFINSVAMQGFVADPTDYMQWAIKALEDAKVYGTIDLNPFTVAGTSTYTFADQAETALDGFGIVIDKLVNIKTLDINTSIAADQTITRDITLAIDPTQKYGQEMIDSEWAVTMIQAKLDALTTLLSPALTTKTEGGMYLIKVSFGSKDPLKITEATESMIPGLDSNLTFALKDGTKIVEWKEDFAQVMRGYVDVLDTPIGYHLSFKNYALKTVDGVDYDKNTTYPFELVNTTLSLSSDSFNLSIGLQKTDNPLMLYLLIGGGVVVVLVGGLLLMKVLKKKPAPVKPVVETPVVETPLK
ncbi:MAG: hypothetical protein HGB31_02795 [Erysipelotrichaceae bacterium]|nr:hypothetical protein [Erysipelotrichaceae bacterium]